MELNDYTEQIRLHVKEYLPGEFKDSEAIIQKQRKNNGMLLHGLSLKSPTVNICPVIYLEDYYELYQRGMSIEDTLRLIVKNYLSAQNSVGFQHDMNLSYDYMKNNLFLCVVNAERNQDILAAVPHQRVEDLAVIYRCMARNNNNYLGSVLVNNSLLKKWGVNKEALHEQALQNMDRLFTPEFHSI